MHPNMDHIDSALLRSFVTVAELGSFTAAAERLGKTQSAISQQMQRLEEDLSVDLFFWEGRRLVLTEMGELVLGYADRILSLQTEIRTRLSDKPQNFTLRLGINHDFAVARLPRLLKQLTASYPEIRFDVSAGLTGQLFEQLEAGKLHVILAKNKPGEAHRPVVLRERLYWIAKDPTLAQQNPLPLAVFPHGCAYRAHILHVLDRHKKPWKVAFACTDLASMKASIEAGIGVTALTSGVIEDSLRIEEPTGLPDLPELEIALHVAPRASHPIIRKVTEFIAEAPWAQTEATGDSRTEA